jgi:hypothetical protein
MSMVGRVDGAPCRGRCYDSGQEDSAVRWNFIGTCAVPIGAVTQST